MLIKMLIQNIKRICSLLLIIMMIVPTFGTIEAFAEDMYHFDDFESYAEGYTAFTSAGYADQSDAKVIVDNGNKCIEVAHEGYVVFDKKSLEEDTDTIVTSVDFKIKDTNTEAAIIGFTGALSQYAKVYLRIKGTDLYFHTSQTKELTDADKIYSGIEVDKWYNAYVVINREEMTRSIYLSGELIYTSSYTHGSDGGEKDYRRRWYGRSKSGTIYYDNVGLYEFSSNEYTLERIKINSIVNTQKNTGYTDGKYPKSAIDMFKDTFKNVTDLQSLNEALEALNQRKIDTLSSDIACAFIMTDVPSVIKAESGKENVVTLEAEAKTVALSSTGDEVAWEIIDTDSEGVSISGNEIIVSENAKSGIVKLKASVGDIYTYETIKINVVAPLNFEGFEEFDEGFSEFINVGYSSASGTAVVEENGNKFIAVAKSDLSDGTIYYQDNTLDADVMVTSVNFMIKDSETEGSIIGFAGALSQYAKVYLRIIGTDLYFSTSRTKELTDADKIYSGIELNKWYNAYVVIDRNSMTRTIYLGGEEIYTSSYTHGSDGGEKDYRNRWMCVATKGTIYIDNQGVFELTNPVFDCARINAVSFINNEPSVGYTDGKYPQGAVDMLRDDYNEADELSSINAAIEKFRSKKIDTSSGDAETAFVRILTPSTVGVSANTANNITLSAEANSIAAVPTGDSITWELVDSTVSASLNTNVLTINTQADGEILLKAKSGLLYAYLPLKIHILRNAQITSFTAEEGKIEVSGTINNKINLGATITAAGTSISASVPLVIAKDMKFTALMNVGAETQWQDVTLTIEGEELNTYSKDVVYYGVGWEDGVKTSVNNCTSVQETDAMLKKYSLGLQVNESLYSKHGNIYATRIFANNPYSDFNALLNKVKDVQFVVEFYETVRSEYETFITNNISFVTSAGLNASVLNGLNDADRYQFYAEVSKITTNLDTDTPQTIAGQLNEILNGVTVPDIPSDPIGTDSPGVSGNNTGGGSPSKGNDFKVNLVPDETKPAENNADTDVNKTQFADVEEGYWASDALLYMREKGIMEGDGTSVRPEDRMTRAEFVKILVTAFELPKADDAVQFTDATGKWWAEYASIAAELGIVNGIGDGSFGGEESITRQMMAVMIDRLITARNISLYDQIQNIDFKDNELIDSYAQEAVIRLGKKGIVAGVGDGLFAPSVTVKRAEAAQIVYNILKQL